MKRQTHDMKNKFERLLAAALMIALCAIFTACGTDDIDISAYENEAITLTGITDQDISLTIADLKAMDCITKSAESTSDKIGKVKATGPTLETVLSQFGSSQTDFEKIHIIATDGYDIKLNRDFLEKNKEIILAFGIDAKPLDGESAPMRLIIPDSDSAYWIRMVNKIECINDGN